MSQAKELLTLYLKLRYAMESYVRTDVGYRVDEQPKPMTYVLDDLCTQQVEQCGSVAVSWALVSSYLYYIQDCNILTDGFFDWLMRYIGQHRATIRHRHLNMISDEDIVMGSLYGHGEDAYPNIVKDTALSLMWRHFRVPPRDGGRVVKLVSGERFMLPW